MKVFVLLAVVACLVTLSVASYGPLDGTYHSTNCESAASLFVFGGYGKRTVTLNVIEYIHRYEHYTDAECTILDFAIIWEGFVNYAGDVVPGVNAVNMGRVLGSIIPLSQPIVSMLTSFCGNHDFELGKSHDIDTMTCAQFGFVASSACPAFYQVCGCRAFSKNGCFVSHEAPSTIIPL
jgi:hypothetical protein